MCIRHCGGECFRGLEEHPAEGGEGIAAHVAKHGQRLVVPDVMTDPRFSAKRIDEMTKWDSFHRLLSRQLAAVRAGCEFQLVNVDMEHFGDQEIFFSNPYYDYQQSQ